MALRPIASMATDATAHAVMAVGMAVGVVLLVAVAAGLAAFFAKQRQQRRLLYTEAVRSASAWKEMVYRVRRRTDCDAPEVVRQFHDIQDQVTYYESWISSESRAMATSYGRLVGGIKDKTLSLIQTAWREPIRPLPGNAQIHDKHPDISPEIADFMRDVRGHLSPMPWRKAGVRRRNKAG